MQCASKYLCISNIQVAFVQPAQLKVKKITVHTLQQSTKLCFSEDCNRPHKANTENYTLALLTIAMLSTFTAFAEIPFEQRDTEYNSTFTILDPFNKWPLCCVALSRLEMWGKITQASQFPNYHLCSQVTGQAVFRFVFLPCCSGDSTVLEKAQASDVINQ